MLEDIQFGCEIFTLDPVAYITVGFRKVVGSTLVECECIKRKIRLSE